MKSNFGNRDFENFVKQNADQYRMFPDDKVWKNIHNTLHTRRKWYGAGLAFLLLVTAGAVTWVMTTNPASGKKQQAITTNNPSINKTIASSDIDKVQKSNVVDKPGQIPGFVRKSAFTNTSLETIPPASIQPIQINQTNNIGDELPVTAIAAPLPQIVINQNQEKTTSNFINELNKPIIIGAETERRQAGTVPASDIATPASKQKESSVPVTTGVNYPLTIESVTNAYRPRYSGKRPSWQFFITPTISYRQLSASDNSTLRNALGFSPSGSRNVNSAVTHRPDLGLQIGVSAAYPLTKSLKLRGGLQFNVNRYDIKASAYNPELATINLNDAYGSSISAWTNYRNYGGYRTDWLKNFYFSVSAPIGIELQLAKGKKMNWGIAGTLQPTYILKDKAYLISTDYKNYAKVPWLVRRVNLSTGVETFIGFGEKTKWQIGPQVRYQVLSSFNNEYPVKEHLFDFGLKVGVFLSNR